jgi:release factor glutamine methyltransferase
MTFQEILKNAELRLKDAGIEEYKSDAWILFSHIYDMDRIEFMMNCLDYEKSNPDPLAFDRLNEAIERRIGHTPVQYITNTQNFYGYDYYVDENVLIPRQDTEVVVECVINTLQAYMLDKKLVSIPAVLDMCTGSGCIAITLSKELNIDNVYASDISQDALDVAKRNNTALNANVNFIESDLFSELNDLKNSLDAIVSNPPYIKSEVIETLDNEVRLNEPRLALDGSEDGLKFYRDIVLNARDFLKDGGLLFFEIGYDQGQEVSALMKENGFVDVSVVKDLAGLNRVCYGHL